MYMACKILQAMYTYKLIYILVWAGQPRLCSSPPSRHWKGLDASQLVLTCKSKSEKRGIFRMACMHHVY